MDAMKLSGSLLSSQYRIRCNGTKVMVGEREFLSATEALEAYISQYEARGMLSKPRSPKAYKSTSFPSPPVHKTYKSTASDVINPKPILQLTAERSLDTGVRDTEQELKLANTKEAINESFAKMKKSSTLRAEARKAKIRRTKECVEDALNRSQELINKIGLDDYPDKTECPSDIGSLNTELLVSMDPAEGYKASLTNKEPVWKSKHVYGYKKPRSRRAKTLSSIEISHAMLGLPEGETPMFEPSPKKEISPHVTFQDNAGKVNLFDGNDDDVSTLLSDSGNSRLTVRSPDRKARERSRSVSPSILKRERKLYESGYRSRPIPQWIEEPDILTHKTPSWVESMDLSNVTDGMWNRRDYTSARPPPSWVNDMEGSEATSIVPSRLSKQLVLEDLLRPLPVIRNTQDSFTSDTSEARAPGLSFRDLVGESPNTQRQGGPPLLTETSKLDPVATLRAEKQPMSKMLRDLQVKTAAALGKYKGTYIPSDGESSSKGGNPYDVPKCSSLDTHALLAGVAPPTSSDITGASPISNDLAGSPARRQCHRRPETPDTDLVLEGDRPWEKATTYKQPVYVGDGKDNPLADKSDTLSGGQQPGSLEALKNMIFKLQQEASLGEGDAERNRSLSEEVKRLRFEAAQLGIGVAPTDKATEDIPALKGYDFKSEPGGHSLEKALVHLSRLKSLVNTAQEEGSTDPKQRMTPLCQGTADT